MKRLLALILSVALVLSICALAGCGNTPDETTGSTPKETTAATTTQGGNDKPEDTTTAGGNTSEDTTTAGGNTSEGTTTVGGNDSEETTTVGGADVVEPTDDYNYYAKLPGYEDIDFGGRVFKIATYEGSDEGGGGRWDNCREVYSD